MIQDRFSTASFLYREPDFLFSITARFTWITKGSEGVIVLQLTNAVLALLTATQQDDISTVDNSFSTSTSFWY
ncbi:hypothetical protein RRG08_024561 [Elysia crispata]|uniref:Uncharacterized protein n=1 Tax=Elysia crispata TaxID=231223 RepID=A0AAE0ZW66_9GAST|nr:hypothetical protein RRG08_024561 [Elysia crispata]